MQPIKVKWIEETFISPQSHETKQASREGYVVGFVSTSLGQVAAVIQSGSRLVSKAIGELEILENPVAQRVRELRATEG